ncbi:MFS transporter [Liquorilactobacillus oeni]|uniref:Major facilitator superfamily protein n=1 Tax=Liquorilactobacillus oeni DSM 19972 TaxID=1423777 RepID=A0A0R1MI85_9LACO|nr:MFS transporter [Liquorilactobacillus oeni]KRL04131.1 major facilitator superfamily protein [Liquorilactobacillus oeni DSM 19972]
MKRFGVQSALLVALSFVLGMSEYIIIGILNDLAATFDVSITKVGFLVTSFAFIYALATPIVTVMVGKHRLYNALTLLFIVFTIGNILTALAPNYTILNISRIITAVVSGPAVSISITFAAFIAPPRKRAWLVSWVFSGFSVASVFGVPLGTWMSDHWGWRVVFWIIAGITIILMILVSRSLPKELTQGPATRIIEQLAIFKDKRIMLGILLPTLNLAGVYVVYTYLRPLAVSGLHFSDNFVTVVLFAYGFAALLSNQISGRIANQEGLKTMEKVYLFQGLSLLLLPLFFDFKWIALLDLFVLGFTMYLLNSPIQIFYMGVAESSYPQSMVLSSSFNSIFSNLGIAIGSATGGGLVSSFGLKSLGIGGAVYTAIALVVLLVLNHHLRQNEY